jgi:hypothetical protein
VQILKPIPAHKERKPVCPFRGGEGVAAKQHKPLSSAALLVEIASTNQQPKPDADAKTEASAKTAKRRRIMRDSAFLSKRINFFASLKPLTPKRGFIRLCLATFI